GGMDHAHHHRLLIGRKAREVGLGADGREGFLVDGCAIGLVDMRHQRASSPARGSATMSARLTPRRAGASRVVPLRMMSKPSAVATSGTSALSGCAPPL